MKLTRLVAATGLLFAVGVGGVMAAAPAIAYPSGTAATATINATSFPPGGFVSVSLKNATPGAGVTMSIESAPVQLGSSRVSTTGTSTVTGNIPAGYSGPHTIVVQTTAGESFSFAILTNVSSGSGGGNNGGGGGGLASTGAAVTGIGILGAALVAGGVFFVMAGRKRGASSTAV